MLLLWRVELETTYRCDRESEFKSVSRRVAASHIHQEVVSVFPWEMALLQDVVPRPLGLSSGGLNDFLDL